MKEFVFTWNIENISFSWNGADNLISSPLFTARPIGNTVWNLQLYPRGKNVGDYLSLFLHRGQDNGPENLSVNFELSCISDEKSLLNYHFFPDSDQLFQKNDGFGHPRFMERYEVFFRRKDLYLPSDVLTLRCRIWQNEGDANESESSFGVTRFEIERILTIENIKPQIMKEIVVDIRSKSQNTVLILINILQYEESIGANIRPINVQNIKSSVLKLSFVEKSSRKLLYEHICSWLFEPKEEKWRLPIRFRGNEDLAEADVELFSEFVYSTGREIKTLKKTFQSSSRLSELVSKYINSCNLSKNPLDCPGISQDLHTLYVEDVLCDVEMKTRTSSIFVHKFVLCARSPVFLAMLTGDTKENRNKCIELDDTLDDIFDDIFEHFLLFLYTDWFEDLEFDAIGLYYVANKYQVKRLKLLCCSYLLKNLNAENVHEILTLADIHDDSEFKRKVEDFILQNDEEIFSSSTWEEFINDEPSLSAKTMFLRYDKNRRKENGLDSYDKMLSKHPTVQDDFIAAFKGKIACDVVIKTADATFYAHKCVLCASSIVMNEILTKDLKEKPVNIFEIQDLEDDTVSRMILFLYSDSLEDVQWGTALQLYHAADVYKIQRLRIKCSCFLLENLETSKASDLLLLAHEHQDVELKSVVRDFMFMHDEEIFGSDEWATFSESNLRLANETMRFKYRKKPNLFES